MAAEFIGVDAINQNLEKLNFDAIGVYDKKLEKFKKIASDDETEEDLITAFNDWCERMIASNPINFKTYSIQLYNMPEGAKKLQGTISFTFALMNPIQANKSDKNAAHVSGEFITKRELELALDVQRLMFENSILKEQLEEEEEEEEEEPATIAGSVQEAIMGKLPQLIDMALMSFAPKQPPAMAGVEQQTDINQTITEFKEINPDIEADLQKLLNLAKTNPQLFNMLIGQLRSM